ncbi:MAG TPA: hypothetical protein VFF03_20310 [Rhodocyclaceae bacterium]|nr:hypothetical protein [Rhodocyclaceae bacterium]
MPETLSLRAAAVLLACCLVLPVRADEACRIAFDLGSSGVRAGSTVSDATARTDIDYLADLWADHHLDISLPATAEAFNQLPRQAGFPPDCARVAGGFSAWRMALVQEGADELAGALDKLHRDSGVAVLVIPQKAEGRYGYVAAQGRLGGELRTTHILDIGGGSLQVAGRDSAWGEALGQKAWNRILCNQLRPNGHPPCDFREMSLQEVAEARRLIGQRLGGLAAEIPGPVTLTAISRPVSQGIHPALRQLAGAGLLEGASVDAAGFDLSAVRIAIDRLAPLGAEERIRLTGITPPFSAYLLSDLILVEGILTATGVRRLEVSELDLSNVPGLLADERAFAWARHYGCYLDRLRQLGEAAYDADPAACPSR